MKQYLMVFGLAYALGVGTVLVIGHNPSSVPVCEIQSPPADLNPSDAGSGDEKFFHSLNEDHFRITSGETGTVDVLPGCREWTAAVPPSFDDAELSAILTGFINPIPGYHPSPDLPLDPYEFDASSWRFQSEHRLTLLNDLLR